MEVCFFGFHSCREGFNRPKEPPALPGKPISTLAVPVGDVAPRRFKSLAAGLTAPLGPNDPRNNIRRCNRTVREYEEGQATKASLALEIATLLRSTNGVVGDSRDEHRQSILGSTENSWRASQAWHRFRPDQRRQVDGTQEGTSVEGRKTFLRNHADGIAAMDLFVVPIISFRLLYGLLITSLGRRTILWFA